MRNSLTITLALGISLCGCTNLMPRLSESLPKFSPNTSSIKRVYCSIKSLGFDLHFNVKTGHLYSYNDFSEKLEPFNINLEIPFAELIPPQAIYTAKNAIGGPDSSITDNNLQIKIYNKDERKESITYTMDLQTLKFKIETTDRDLQIEPGFIAASKIIEQQFKCEYIKPETTKTKGQMD